MKKTLVVVAIGILTTLIAVGSLFQSGFHSSQDNMHPLRLQDYALCRKDGQIPCRYVNQSGYNCGYPLFNFYAPLSYEIGLFLKTISLGQLDFVSSIKGIYIFSTLLSFFGTYLFAKKYTTKLGGLISASLYTIAPYKAVDIFVRGSLAEYVALCLLPWTLLSINSYQSSNKKSRLIYIFTILASILSHNLFPVLFGPLIVWTMVSVRKNTIYNKNFYIDSLLSIGLASFFLIPSILEKSLTTNSTMTLGYFNFVNHFATLNQLFISRFWGFGASLWGPVDDMSFQIGHLHWILLVLTLAVSLKNKKVTSLVLLFFIYIFLTHNKSTPIWQTITVLQYLQFPWRFLGPAIFTASFAIGMVFNKNKAIFIAIIFMSLILYKDYSKAEKWDYALNDSKKFSGELLLDQQRSGLPDYWPNYGKELPTTACYSPPGLTNITIQNYSRKTNQLLVQGISQNDQTISLPLVYFPNWQTNLNGQKTSSTYDKKTGLITVTIPSGEFNISITRQDSNIQRIANLLTLLSLLILLIIFSKKWSKK